MKRRFNKVALSFAAHPDDAEAFCAGTLKLLKDKGYEIVELYDGPLFDGGSILFLD